MSLRNVILIDFGAKWNSKEFLKTDHGVNNQPIAAPKVSKDA